MGRSIPQADRTKVCGREPSAKKSRFSASRTLFSNWHGLGHVTRATRLGESRYALELPLTPPPERVLADLVAQGAQLVSLNPLRDTLEDVFVRQVNAAPRSRGLEPA